MLAKKIEAGVFNQAFKISVSEKWGNGQVRNTVDMKKPLYTTSSDFDLIDFLKTKANNYNQL